MPPAGQSYRSGRMRACVRSEAESFPALLTEVKVLFCLSV